MKLSRFVWMLFLPMSLFAQSYDGDYEQDYQVEFLSNEIFVEEDFDGDGLPDQVSVSLFSDGTRDLNVDLSAGVSWTNPMILLGPEDGGVFGDPLDGIGLDEDGNLVISFFGGSREKWFMEIVAHASFGDMEVVSYTSGWFDSFDPDAGDTTTWNLYSGEFTNEAGTSLGNYLLPEPMFLESANLNELEGLIYAARAGELPEISDVYY